MDEERFDAIVVGAGLAGCAAAYKMVQEGLEVLLIERGNYAGAKNMTGGRIYTHSLEKLIPDFREIAPLERKVTKEKISIISDNQATTIEYASNDYKENEESYTILRARFDQWLAEQVEEAGGMVVAGVQADELILEDGKVVGVKVGEDDMYGNVVVIADGVNSMLAEKAGLRKPVTPEQMAVGAKDVYELSPELIEARFGQSEGEGTAWLSMGDVTRGLMGGGFIYTNKESISVGMVVSLAHIGQSDKNIEEMMNDFVATPAIAPLLKDAKLVERSGHVVPEAGFGGVSNLSGDGYVIVGDAAGLCMNLGYTVRGMDLAIESGIHAAQTIIEAKAAEDYSAAALKKYDDRVLNSPSIGGDMKLTAKFPEFMETDRIFKEYPQMVNGIMHDVFRVNDQGAEPIMKKMMRRVKKVGIINLAKDGWKGVHSL